MLKKKQVQDVIYPGILFGFSLRIISKSNLPTNIVHINNVIVYRICIRIK